MNTSRRRGVTSPGAGRTSRLDRSDRCGRPREGPGGEPCQAIGGARGETRPEASLRRGVRSSAAAERAESLPLARCHALAGAGDASTSSAFSPSASEAVLNPNRSPAARSMSADETCSSAVTAARQASVGIGPGASARPVEAAAGAMPAATISSEKRPAIQRIRQPNELRCFGSRDDTARRLQAGGSAGNPGKAGQSTDRRTERGRDALSPAGVI